MVRSIAGISQSRSSVERKHAPSLVKWKETTRLGETEHFIVDYDGKERLIIVYGKEVPVRSSFKLRLSRSQAIGISELLKKAIYVTQEKHRLNIGEKSGFIVDYDGTLVMLYRKETQTECRFKLALDRDDTTKMVRLLKKAYNFF